ncbi:MULTISPECIES: hypothetical protein [Reichenbachiella]|uniref:Uncharacterized protein n=1 Tax=Reichenbachiella agariperforans TaxID=156994 RepID=A0A1M6SZ06_REIAG|nr:MULTISPECIES: hypothetical protein [Reichenbachiella]RJE75173.1 hypothetical protein BGP76_18890 [Reichenbachiella sp. MSK19-1]SHK49973.1 hypothetical protein SAMN04488028_105215 [Reichenbachiella agariperforans]
MKFDPPIASRSTDELIEIANFPEDWNASAVEQAQCELSNRGVSEELQQKKVTEWKKQLHAEHKIEMATRAIESFGWYDLFWMAIRWPYTIVFGGWSLKKEGFLRMHKERLYSIVVGILLWVLMLVWVDWSYNRSQRKFQNEVNNADIYEWENDNYSDEEIIEFRKKSIEQLIETVRSNETNGTPTYVIVDQDTIPNSEVEQLRNMNMLNIRNVVFEGDFEPEPHEWITIKLVKPTRPRL